MRGTRIHARPARKTARKTRRNMGGSLEVRVVGRCELVEALVREVPAIREGDDGGLAASVSLIRQATIMDNHIR